MIAPDRNKAIRPPRTAEAVAMHRCPRCGQMFASNGVIRTPAPECPGCRPEPDPEGRRWPT